MLGYLVGFKELVYGEHPTPEHVELLIDDETLPSSISVGE
jgi:hypothetical protein